MGIRRRLPSRWWAVTAHLSPAEADLAAWSLGRDGSAGIELEEPGADDERSRGGPVRLRAFFSTRAAATGAARALRRELQSWRESVRPAGADERADTGRIVVEPVTVDPRAWREAWRQTLRPVRGGGIRVSGRPARRRSGSRVKRDSLGPDGLLHLVIPPGMAFGTGHHPSTQQALWALELAMRGTLSPGPVVDIGTGTGVLAIAARRLGAERVVAVDRDPEAVRAARDNAGLNGVRSLVLRVGSVEQALREVGTGGAALVLANLVAETLVELAEPLARLVRPGGWLVGAGIVEEKAPDVEAAFAERGLVPEERGVWSGWAWVSARRPVEVAS